MKKSKTNNGQAEKLAHNRKEEDENMKQYTNIIVTGSPEFIKRFNRCLKSHYNVNYPDFEKRYTYRKLNFVTVSWTVKYHDNWFFGNSEECLYAIARAAAEEHMRHTHNSRTGNWGVCSK